MAERDDDGPRRPWLALGGPADDLDDPDDLDRPPSAEELAAAAGLRDELAADGAGAGWLRAHLRAATEEDVLGDVRSRGIARAAREALQQRRALLGSASGRAGGRARPGHPPAVRLLREVGPLFLSVGAGLLLLTGGAVWLESFMSGRAPGRAEPEIAAPGPGTQLLLRASLKRGESATARLDIMIEERRAAALHARGASALLVAGAPGVGR